MLETPRRHWSGCAFYFISTLNVVLVQVNPELKSHFEEKGFRFVGQDVEGERMEVIELDGMGPETLVLNQPFHYNLLRT